MRSPDQGWARSLFGALPVGVAHRDQIVTFFSPAPGPVVDGLAQSLALRSKRVGEGSKVPPSEFKSLAVPFLVLSLRTVLN